MKTLIVSIALGTAALATPSFAQPAEGGAGYMQRDVTRAQAQQMADMMFQRLDTNRDGVVTRAEADQGTAQFSSARGGGRMQRMIARAFGDAPSLTQQQFEAQALVRFDAQDLNHDGTVSAAERQQARAAREAAAPGQ